jgi:SAM-dependent methyltransferase
MASDPDTDARARQQRHWAATFAANADMYGAEPSEAAVAAAGQFVANDQRRVLELGPGQGRDTLFLAQRGFEVVAVDYAGGVLDTIAAKARGSDLTPRVSSIQHDVRKALPFSDESFDASYSHMLFCMALTTRELEHLANEVRRVIRPRGLVVYTVRHTGDAHYGSGTPHGDDMFEQGGFIVHFFDRHLVERLADGFELVDVTAFTEGELPRRLWQVTMRKSSA